MIPIIAIEGPDGVGKTTVVNKVMELLTQKGINVKYKHFPEYAEPSGQLIQKCLFGGIGDFKLLNPAIQHQMYAIDRMMFFKNLPVEYQDAFIITDRYTSSSIVYQTVNLYRQAIRFEDPAPYCEGEFEETWSHPRRFEWHAIASFWERRNMAGIYGTNLYSFAEKMYKLEEEAYDIPPATLQFYLTLPTFEEIYDRLEKRDGDPKLDNFEEDRGFQRMIYDAGKACAKSFEWLTYYARDDAAGRIFEYIMNTMDIGDERYWLNK